MARPDLTVIVTMGDGGLGIGGAHVLSTCRRNIDLTLLVLNNFNYGMTGGQCSSTTPSGSRGGFRISQPAGKARSTSARWPLPPVPPYVTRTSSYDSGSGRRDGEAAIEITTGFRLVDMWGMCPGRYTKRNKLNPQDRIDARPGQSAAPLSADRCRGINQRPEYGRAYTVEDHGSPSRPPKKPANRGPVSNRRPPAARKC